MRSPHSLFPANKLLGSAIAAEKAIRFHKQLLYLTLPFMLLVTGIALISRPGGLWGAPGDQVSGADYTVSGPYFQSTSSSQSELRWVKADGSGGTANSIQLAVQPRVDAPTPQRDQSGTKEKSFNGNLTLPDGARETTFTSEITKAPSDFSDVAPHWWADVPADTAVSVELRTSKDGSVWGDWLPAEEEEIINPRDTLTQTYAGLLSVNQIERTHRYVQSRVTLRTAKLGITPTFHELTYTFINAGVTAKPPKAQMMLMGTPSEAPKPALVPRADWGSPEGKSSPGWAPKFKRVTHIVIHHTGTSNKDTDFAARVRAIWYYHSRTRGWGDIGYNYLIDPNGVIYEGRSGGDDVEAGHSYPFNVGTMGVALVGNFSASPPSATAQAALIDLISWKANQRGINPLGTTSIKGTTACGEDVLLERPAIAGHRDFKGTACGRKFNSSTCPGDRLYNLIPQIRNAIVAEQPPLRAVFTGHDTPGNLEPGATVDVHLTVRNSGSLTWQPTGQGAVSLGYRWLTPDGKPAPGGWTDLKTALPGNVPFAGTITVTAKLNVPALSGHYAVVWDMARDGEGWFGDHGSRPLRVDVVIGKGIGDAKPPQSEVLPLPVYSSDLEPVVRWTGEDDPKGSGLASYDVQFRIIPQGAWTDWKKATAETQAAFEGQDGYTYGFRSRARDVAGNVEEWRDEPDAYTIIDTRPPALSVDTPSNGAYVESGKLEVKGRTEPGAFVAVNDKRAEEKDGAFSATVEASGRDFIVHVTASDAAGNVARLEITVQAAQRYTDVPVSHPAFLAIEYLSDQSVMSGYDDGTFKPDTLVTRAQLAKTAAGALHWGLIQPDEPRFSDVPLGTWMYPYVETAAARKVMDGYPDGTFQPGANVTRSTAVRSLVVAAGWKLVAPASGHFQDVSQTNRLYPYIETAYAHGVIKPDEDGKFNTGAQVTRASLSLMVYGLLEDLISNNPSLPGDDYGP